MRTLVCVVLLMDMAAAIRFAPGSNDLSLNLTVDRTEYYVGEPLKLSLIVRNDGSQTARGFFNLAWWDDTTHILRRSQQRPFERVMLPPRGRGVPDFIGGLVMVKPGTEWHSELLLAADPTTNRLILDQPGDYEFKVRCRGANRGAIFESAPARLRVVEPPRELRPMAERYMREGLALLVQSPSPDVSSRIATAERFLQDHPHGPYASHVRSALVTALKVRVLRGLASAREKALLDRLSEMEPPE